MIAPQGLEIREKLSYCENTTKPTTLFFFHDLENILKLPAMVQQYNFKHFLQNV